MIGYAWAFLFLPLLALAGTPSYDFPYTDPYYASITAAILKVDQTDHDANYRDLNLPGIPERNSVPFYGANRNYLKMRVWTQKQPAPLIVMVAGLGGAASSTYYNYLGYKFHQQGFQVLVLPSPFHWTFALSASRSGLPGITRNDAEDLYQTMIAGIAAAKKATGMQISSYGLLGVSMGALESAFVSEIDAREQKINFSKILLVNPPVNPVASAARLDALAAAGNNLSADARKNLQENIYLFGIKAMVMMDINDPNYFLRVEQELPTTIPERQFLIGSSLRDFLEALVFTTQQVQDLGVLQAPVTQNKEKPDARLEESRTFSYTDYMEKILFPGLSRQAGHPVALNPADVNLSGVEAHLRADTRVFLMDNADDFIVDEAELNYMQSIFGERMSLYPHGGHVGNIWYPENLQAILGTFSSLK